VQRWVSDLIGATLLPGLAPGERLVDGPMVAATMAAAAAAGVAAGLAPLGLVARGDVVAGLREGTDSGGVRRWPLRNALVGLQVALCTVLLVGAGLFVRSFARVQAQDLGFSTRRLLVADLDFRDRLPGGQRDALHREAARRLARLPGVTGATVVQAYPFGPHTIPPISVPGRSAPPQVGMQLPALYGVTPEYLRMMRVTLREGRLLTGQDGAGAPLVVLVNETMARGVWPGESALGKCIRFGFGPQEPPGPLASADLPCREVVGVVRDSRVRSIRPDGIEGALMQYYAPLAQMPPFPFGDAPSVFGLMIETAGDPAGMVGPVQRLLAAPGEGVSARVRPYQELLDPQMRSWKLGASLFSAFGAMTLAMAAVGLFGIISYLVTQRRREMGIRLALGGGGGRVARLVMNDALRTAGAGVAVGLVIALAVAPRIQHLLFQTPARDPVVLFGVGVTLLGVTLIAAAAPAWRAARVSPLEALRAD
jgi:predicted permease